MKVDGGLMDNNLEKVPSRIKTLESMGYSGVLTAETGNDPFFPLLLAAEHSQDIELMTSIAVAFARSPMILANLGHDLNAYSKGRFILGLGSQIKPHITKRFSMPWHSPAAQMRELIMAMRAIWDNWYKGVPLNFKGDYYTHTLMTPMFTPTNTEYGPPQVMLAAVGPKMTEVAGEVADGILIHAFTNERYMREVTLPAIDAGLKKSGRSREDFQICYPGFIVSGDTEETFNKNKVATCKQIAFYGSTPAYKGVLDAMGWGDLQGELNLMSKQGRWDDMGTKITDDMLSEFAIVGEPSEIATKMKARYGDMVDRLSAGFPYLPEQEQADIINALKAV